MDNLNDFSKIAIYCPSILFCKAAGDKILRVIIDIFFPETEQALVFRWGPAFCLSEKRAKGTNAVKPHGKTCIRYFAIFL